MHKGIALTALLLLSACTGDDEDGSIAATCGSCSIPICGSPSRCDCSCFQGDTMRNGELVCTADSCFAPAGGSGGGGGKGGASTAGTSGASGSRAGADGGGAGNAQADGGLPQDAAADAAVDASGGSGAVIDAAVTPMVCTPIDVQAVRNPETGCRFELNVVVRAGDECLGLVRLNGFTLECLGPDGWRMPDMTTVELVGTACAALQGGSDVRVDVDFPCKTIIEVR